MSKLKKYEIWIGVYSQGQGMPAPYKAEKVGEQEAIAFDIACLKFELKTMLKSIESQEKKGYVDEQSKHWFYNPHNNSNDWSGKYYETREEAQKAIDDWRNR